MQLRTVSVFGRFSYRLERWMTLGFVGALLLCLLPSLFDADASAASPPKIPTCPGFQKTPLPLKARVIRVIDGDTLEITGNLPVRLTAVNAPESSERIGKWVTRQVTRLLDRKEVTLEYGDPACDHYGRLLATVRLDGQLIEELLLSQGLAHVFVIGSPPPYYEALLQAQLEAKNARRGIWADPTYPGPLHITSFHANARGQDAKDLSTEYLRIANISNDSLNLAGFVLANSRGQQLTFPPLELPAGFAVKVMSGMGTSRGDATTPFEIYWNSESEIWNNRGDRALLYDPKGNLIERCDHFPESPLPD